MKSLTIIISMAALGLTVIPSLLFLAGAVELSAVQWTMALGTLVWFLSAPFWMKRDKA
jgi:hypothetical protein